METEQPPKSRRPVAKWVAILLLLIIVIVVLLWYFVFRDTSPADVNSQAAEEARDEAEAILKKAASFGKDRTGDLPALSIREGETISELKKFIDEEKTINVLVLAASTDSNSKNPGPIITSLVTNEITNLRVPIMIVPGNFSIEHIAQIT